MTRANAPARDGAGTVHRSSVAAIFADDVVGAAIGSRAAFPIFLLVHLGICTLSATFTLGWGSLHPDMTEAWMWGKEFQLGYAKHPPAFAWVAGAWFSLLPRSDWSFYLLAEVNAAIGLAGVWMIAGKLLDHPGRWAAMLLLSLMPFFSVSAAKYNANSALLASWPWAVYFFIRSLETRRLRDAAAFGALTAVALLTKYYSAVLLGSCVVAALLHPARAGYLRSPAPYVAAVVGALLVLPHALWVVATDFPTLKYALSKTAYAADGVRLRAGGAVLTSFAYLSLATATFAFVFRQQLLQAAQGVVRDLYARETAWLSALTFLPVLLTVALALFGNVRIATAFLIPTFFMLPIFIVRSAAVQVTASMLARLAWVVAALWCALLLIAPPLGYATLRFHWGPPDEPHREFAHAASELWHQAFATRLNVVTGDEPYCRALAFYGADAPSFFSLANPSTTPWGSRERLMASGFLMVCRREDAACLAAMNALDRAGARRVRITVGVQLWGYTGPSRDFDVLMVPPAAEAPR